MPTRAVASGLIDRFGSIDPSEGGNTERYNANMLLTHSLANGAIWQHQFYYSRYAFNLYSDFTFFLLDTIHGDAINQAEHRQLAGYRSTYSHNYFLKQGTLTTTYGAGVRYDAITNSKLAHVAQRQFLNNIELGNIQETNAYAFAEGILHQKRWLLQAGARFDCMHFWYFDNMTATALPAPTKTIASPKITIQYTLNPRVQLYVKGGKGFHSNDTRVVTANKGVSILPAAYGADADVTFKPANRLLVNMAIWYMYLQQEFVYVGDEGNIEPSGKTQRKGIDLIARYQFHKNWFANVNVNLTQPRALDETKGQNYIPLAPTAASTGGVYYKAKEGINGSLSWRYIKDRPANEDYSITAKGYFLVDGAVDYNKKNYELGVAVENIFNTIWNEAQFATRSRLRGEAVAVDELNFTPGTPLFVKFKIAVTF